MMTIQDKLVLLRKKKGWSQEDLAEKIDVSRQAISRWENGTALPDAENLRQLSHLYEVSTDYLLNDELESNDDLPQEKTDEENDTATRGCPSRRWCTAPKKLQLQSLRLQPLCLRGRAQHAHRRREG